MKKFILIIMATIFAATAFADGGPTCRVWGTNGIVAAVSPTYAKVITGTGFYVKDIRVSITVKSNSDIGVAVEVVDRNGNVVGTETFFIRSGNTNSDKKIIYCNGVQVDDQVTLRIASASCQ